MKLILFPFFVALFARVRSTVPLFSLAPSSGVGERLLNELRGQILSHGPCWHAAVEKLETSCSSLTENAQHRLALAFTSCFVRKMGHPGYSCAEDEAIEVCADFKSLSSSGHLGSYSTFFTHAHVICSFLQQQRWQGATLDVINALSTSSAGLSSQLSSLNEAMTSTREDQNRLHEFTRVALHENQKLTEKISSQGSSMSVMLDQIHYVNTIIASHASTLSSFAYFLGGVLVSFLLTTPEQTRQARPWLLLLFTANLLMELAILQWALEISGLSHEYFKADNPISFRLSLCRRTFCCLSFVLYLYKAVTYRSPEERSHYLLLEVSSTVTVLDQRLQRIEMALTSAAARVRKTYDNIDGFRGGSPMRFREVTPLRAPPAPNTKTTKTFQHRDGTREYGNGRTYTKWLNDNETVQEKAAPKIHEETERFKGRPQTETTQRRRPSQNARNVESPVRRSSRIRSPA